MTTENPQLESELTEESIDVTSLDEFIEETTSHKDTIQTVIGSMDSDNTAMVSQTQASYLWKFQYGSVEVFVQLTGESDDDLFTVWAAVLTFPVNDELGLLRKLMEMNWSGTFETCFSRFNQQIVVSCQRTVAELSPGEISRTITLVATIADDNDEALKEQFGGS
jgi:hypothetical protein